MLTSVGYLKLWSCNGDRTPAGRKIVGLPAYGWQAYDLSACWRTIGRPTGLWPAGFL